LVTKVIEEPTSNTGREAYKKRRAKAKRVNFYSVKDSMMPIIGHLRTAKECFDALANLYEKKAPTQNRILKKQLCKLRMRKDETIVAFFSKIDQTRDQLTAIGVVVDDDDLVQIAVDGLPESWGIFLASVNGREAQPNFERLWHDCLEEEGKLKSRHEQENMPFQLKPRDGRSFLSPKAKVRNHKVSYLISILIYLK
jgi:hypothetical protein